MTFADGGNIVDLMDGRLLGMHSECDSVYDSQSVRELSRGFFPKYPQKSPSPGKRGGRFLGVFGSGRR